MVCHPGWRVYRCWQQGNNACFCATCFSGVCAWGYIMCTFVANQHHSCRTIPSLWMITYQENWIGHFVSVYEWTEWLPWLDGFLVSLLWSKRSLMNVSLCTVSSIEKCWLAEKCHLLTTFCRIWLKLSTTLENMPLTHVCSYSFVKRWTQSTHVFSYTQKWDGFLKVEHWPEFLSYESCSRDFFQKKSPMAAHFSDTEWVAKLAYLCDIFNLLNELNLSLQGRTTTVFKSADKMAAFKAKLELWGQRVNIGIFDMIQTLAEILKETKPGPSFSQLVHDHLSQLSKEFEHYFPTTKDPQTGKEWIHNPFVNKPGESTLSVKRINCSRSQMTVTLKVCLRQLHISIRSGLKSRRNILRLPQKHWKACFHFQHPIFVKQGFLQWQQPKRDYGVQWT